MELFRDSLFRQGMALTSTFDDAGAYVAGVLSFATPQPTPCWRVAQWGSRFPLEGTQPKTTGSTMEYANAGKRLARTENADGTVTLTMDIYGKNEYTHPRAYGEPWPHILVEQQIASQPKVSERERLMLHMDWTIGFCRDHMGEAYNEQLHTAQVTAYFTIHNMNPQSAGYKDFLWFGIPIFDCRHPVYPEYLALDEGKEGASGKLIYTVSGARVYPGAVTIGSKQSIHADMLLWIQEGLEKGHNSGYLTTTRLEDLYVTSFNLGWEVTGTYDCSFSFTGLSLEG